MKKSLLSLVMLSAAITLKAQTTFVTDFESMTLPDYNGKVYNDSTNAAGEFKSGHATFPTQWFNSSFGGYYSGWAASSFHDSSTAGYTNIYGCAAYKGYNNSNVYAIGTTYSALTVRLTDSLIGKTVTGLYICNATYPAKSMLNGDGFAKKFGDTTGTHCGCPQGSAPDWFKVTIKRYSGGVLQNDSVTTYLADYRFSNNAQDYILKTWTWINLTSLGNVDSLSFSLSSSDVGSFGMNTPGFFCIDDLTLSTALGVENYNPENGLAIFPNPAGESTEIIYNTSSPAYVSLKVMDVTGNEVTSQNLNSFAGENRFKINTAQFAAGVYYVTLSLDGKILTKKLIKQ